ncbi:YppF family protein [Virgibacillus byunsanensis]|uniref:YppF family protein n=1 Tax=Virgibacillus byunsanensis TaxID=570945 RepID=A0ABW3LH07_9BACI
MQIDELRTIYEQERKQQPESMNVLLDFLQMKYVLNEVEAKDYRRIYHTLIQEGAISAHEYPETTNV